MYAVVHFGKEGMEGLQYKKMEIKEPKEGEVRVRLKRAALNHRDLFILYRHPKEDPPLILGSDGAGIVEAVGSGVKNVQVGDEVIINPSLGWEKKSAAPPAGYEILGMPDHGTFAETIVISSNNVAFKPRHLTWDEAGGLSLAALTAYRALFTKAKVQAGEKVLIPGIGGGVATFLLQFAKAVGAKVYVTSRSEEKCKKALALGADAAIMSDSNWNEALQGEKVDVAIDCVGPATFEKSLAQLRPGGRIVTFGSSTGDALQFNVREFFYGQFHLLGTTMGSTEEYNEMLQLLERHNIKPVIDHMFPLHEYEKGFRRLEEAEQFGKVGFII